MQGAIFSPHIISLVSVSFLWLWLMDPNYGLLNWLLNAVGIPKMMWLQSPDTALLSIILVAVWKSVGYNTLILIAALQSIPKSIIEAATIDRATKSRLFFKIIIPLVSPALFFLVIINLLMAFQAFETVAIMTQGGPINSTNILVYYIYENGFRFYKMGNASAAGVILFVIISIVTLVSFNSFGKKVHYR